MLSVKSIKGDYNLIGYWYLTSVMCGRADKIFYAAPHNLKDILAWFDRLNICLGAFKDDQLIGVGFVDTIIQFNESTSRGEIGFGYLPCCTVIEALATGRMMINTILNITNGATLVGTTPEPNKSALAFAKRLGFKQFGPIPHTSYYLGEVTGTYTSIMTKEEWNGRKQKSI